MYTISFIFLFLCMVMASCNNDQELPFNFLELRVEELTFYNVLSLFVQKILLLIASPLAKFGLKLETWLNRLSCNSNLFFLLFNLFRGKKVEEPERESENFMSFIGYMDKRTELDKNIKPNDSRRYYPALAAMASKLAYENQAVVKNIVQHHWKMEYIDLPFDYYNDFQNKHTTQACVFRDTTTNPDLIVVAFRGTEAFDAYAWCTDVDISWYDFPNIGKIHGGFMKALGLQSGRRHQRSHSGWPVEVNHDPTNPLPYYTIRNKLRTLLGSKTRTRFIVTGHSLGGALAILFASVLVIHDDRRLLERLEGVYTFGQPRVGDRRFGECMDGKFREHRVKYLRYVYSFDVVPRLPMDDNLLLFKHFGTCMYYNSLYKGQIVKEEPNKNYFMPLIWIIPMLLTAKWEVIRGLMIGYVMGREYEEGWLLIYMRFLGLSFPGLAAHNLQDYVNLTRIGTLKLQHQ